MALSLVAPRAVARGPLGGTSGDLGTTRGDRRVPCPQLAKPGTRAPPHPSVGPSEPDRADVRLDRKPTRSCFHQTELFTGAFAKLEIR